MNYILNFNLLFTKRVKRGLKTLMFIITALLFFTEVSYSQISLKKQLKISVHILGLKDGYYYLNGTDQAGIDSCKAKNGNLTFKYFGEPAGLYIASTKDNGSDGTTFGTPIFWIDKSDVIIKGKASDIKSMEVIGSPVNVKLQRLSKILKPLREQRMDFMFSNKLAEADSIKRKISSIYKEEISHNINTNYGMILLYYLAIGKTINASETEYLLNMFNDKLKDSRYTQAVKSILINSSSIDIGKLAPDFVQLNTDNKKVALSDYRGKFVLLEFWGSWCGPCRDENPELVKIYKKFSKSGFEIVGVSVDVNRQTWLQAIKNDNLTWPQLSDLRGQSNEAALLYNINAVPSNFLIDPKGVIIALNLRGDALYKKLSEIFQEK